VSVHSPQIHLGVTPHNGSTKAGSCHSTRVPRAKVPQRCYRTMPALRRPDWWHTSLACLSRSRLNACENRNLAPLGLPKREEDDHREDDHQYGKPLFLIKSVRRVFETSHVVLLSLERPVSSAGVALVLVSSVLYKGDTGGNIPRTQAISA
jgi:hypothetical protein